LTCPAREALPVSYATAGIALRVTGVLKPPHHDKVEPPMRRKHLKQNKKYELEVWLHFIP
jgi:hypothetical protein